MEPKHYLNTPGGARIPVYGMKDDWADVGIQVMSKHPDGGQIFAGDGIIWHDAKGMAVAIAGEPDQRVMSLVRADQPIRV